MNLGKRVKEARKKLGISQRELARLADIHYTQVCKYEKGDVLPSIEILKKIADILQVSIDYLAYDEEKDNPEAKIQDKELLTLFVKINHMDDKGKNLVKEFIDAMIKKQDLEKMMK